MASYFSYLPNIELAVRPIQFPWSEQQYKVAKNIFRRFKINDSALDTAMYFRKLTVTDADRPDVISQKVYGTSDYDWVILMSNNVINPYFDWPMSQPVLDDYINQKYDAPYEVKHYETREVKNSAGATVLPEGQIVDESFFRAPYWIEFNETTGDFPKPDNETNLTVLRKIEVTGVTLLYCNTGVCTPSVTTGWGYESVPTITFAAPYDSLGDLSPVRATGTAVMSDTGYLKRFDITSPGENYEYPPIVTFDGGLAGESATAVINEQGQVTEIRLDGTKFDTTVADNIYEFGNGTTIASNGTGVGTTGGFDVGGTHLRFGDSPGTRYATLNPVDMSTFDTVRVYAVRGNGSNGGETPDINGTEDLYLRYQITDGAPVEENWVNLGIVIEAVPNGSGTGVLTNYDFVVPANVRTQDVYFQLYQPGNSGSDYDHYGITTINFINTTAEYTDSNVYFTNNPLDTTGGGAAATVVLGKRIAGVTITNGGSYEDGSQIGVSITGGNPVQNGWIQAIPTESPNTFNVGEEITFSNGVIANVTAYTGNDMTIEVTTGNAQNPVSTDMVFSRGASVGVVRSVVSTNLSEPTYVDKQNNYFRYKINRSESNTSGWEKLVRDSFRYRDPNGNVVTLTGFSIAKAVTFHDYETALNDKKREIYILKERYLSRFIQEMKTQLPYKKSGDYISKTLKRSAL
tara:strand:- start:1320 stop:3383 length:2064 start_codon:yes stop_codon:yes gene_type:complete